MVRFAGAKAMTRTILERRTIGMAKFSTYSNNGVYAVVTEEVMEKIESWKDMKFEAEWTPQLFQAPYPKPIFTFSDAPGLRGIVTGTLDDKKRLLQGHQVVSRGFFVPFSNCGDSALLLYANALTEELRSDELCFMTTIREVMDAFGLVPSPERVVA